MKQAGVTTVIPTFRRPQLLKRAIRSALNQTYDTIAVKVFDNASGDETADVVADFIRRDPRVEYFCHSENIGFARNFQFAMSRVQTPYFSILNDDDLLLPALYQAAVDALEHESAAMFFAGATIFADFGGRFRGRTLHDWQTGTYHPPAGLYSILRAGNPFWTSVVFRREVVSQVGLCPEAGIVLDRDFLIRIAARYPFVVSTDPGAVFFSNPGSPLSSMTLDQLWNDGLTIIRNMNSVLSEQHKSQALRLFQRELGDRVLAFAQTAAMNGDRKQALDAARLMREDLHRSRDARWIGLLTALSALGLGWPVRFAAQATRVFRHLPSYVRTRIDERRYAEAYGPTIADLLQTA